MQQELDLLSVVLAQLSKRRHQAISLTLFEHSSELVFSTLKLPTLSSNEKLRKSLLKSLLRLFQPLSTEVRLSYVHKVWSVHFNKDISIESQAAVGKVFAKGVGNEQEL